MKGYFSSSDRGYQGSMLSVVETTQRTSELRKNFQSKNRRAMVLHLFYPEILSEILHQDIFIGESFDFYITIPSQVSPLFFEQLKQHQLNAYVTIVENKGRDVLPFLQILPLLMGKYEWVCKLHSKKSLHSVEGKIWRQEVFAALLRSRVLDILDKASQDVGIFAPPDSLLPLDLFLGSNEGNMKIILQRLRYSDLKVTDYQFVAGTMFWFRPQALIFLSNRISELIPLFTEEQSAIDGLMPHAFERIFSLVAEQNNFQSRELK
ncbi:MAG: hypothetical protein H6623_01140 [Bdellovibrionaceae bacterium]|nr:hypothetical protein [Pseudobdellovibrionaceae bacterium]